MVWCSAVRSGRVPPLVAVVDATDSGDGGDVEVEDATADSVFPGSGLAHARRRGQSGDVVNVNVNVNVNRETSNEVSLPPPIRQYRTSLYRKGRGALADPKGAHLRQAVCGLALSALL